MGASDIIKVPYYRGEAPASTFSRPAAGGRPVAGGVDFVETVDLTVCSELRKDGETCRGGGVLDGLCVGHRRAKG